MTRGRTRATRTRIALPALAAAVAVLSACGASNTAGSPSGLPTGGSASGSASGSPTPAPTGPTPSLSPFPTPGATAGLRGVPVARVDCSVRDQQPQGTARPLHGTPRRVVLCPLALPPPTGTPKPGPVELSPPPAPLLAALATADPPPPTESPYACAAYADLPQAVFAVMPDGSVYRVRIPQDGACNHYLPAVLQVLAQYRPAASSG